MKNFHRPAVLPQRRGRNPYHLKSKGRSRRGRARREESRHSPKLSSGQHQIRISVSMSAILFYRASNFWFLAVLSHPCSVTWTLWWSQYAQQFKRPVTGFSFCHWTFFQALRHRCSQHTGQCMVPFDRSSLTWVSLLARSHCLAQCPGAGGGPTRWVAKDHSTQNGLGTISRNCVFQTLGEPPHEKNI